jgi:hypothetical protein
MKKLMMHLWIFLYESVEQYQYADKATVRLRFETLYILHQALPQNLALVLNLTRCPTGANKDLKIPGE